MVVYTLYDGDARVRREAETLVATGLYEVDVLCLKESDLARHYTLSGVDVQQLGVRKYRGGNPARYILSYLHFTWLAFLELTRRAVAGTVDVVHIHNMPNFLIMAAIVPILRKRTVILDIHDTMAETFAGTFPPTYRPLFLTILVLEERLCCAMADHIICVNDVQRDVVVRRQPGARAKTVVSMNVPDPRRFALSTTAPEARPAHDRFRLVYHGTVSARLNVALAVEAVAHLASAIPSIELNIIGDGEIKESLVALTKQRGIEQHVIFHQRVSLEAMIPLLQDMDLGIVPLQRNDATELMLPVKLMECISLGVPVVAPRLPAIQHYFTEDMLFFFDPGDLPSLAAAISAAFEVPTARQRKVVNARRFLTQYDWSTHQASLLEIYATAGTRNRPAAGG